MKLQHFAVIAGLAAVTAALPSVAKADVTWQHDGTISVGSMPGAKVDFTTYTSFTENRERFMVQYSLPMALPLGMPGQGSAGLITRLDDDKLIGFESNTKSYFSDSRKLVMWKLLANPLRDAASKLSKEPAPELTEAQRIRLGAEVRAMVAPALDEYAPSYFHKMDNVRTFNGIEGHGYRLTQMINTSGDSKAPQWAQVSAEWWLAAPLNGDDVIYGLEDAATDQNRMLGIAPSRSMLQNELGYVMVYALPEPYIQAIKTLAPGPSLEDATFGGTPLALYITVKAPDNAMGDIKISMTLTNRYVSHLADSVFDAPDGYSQIDDKPFLLKLDQMHQYTSVDSMMKQFQKNMPHAMGMPGMAMPMSGPARGSVAPMAPSDSQ